MLNICGFIAAFCDTTSYLPPGNRNCFGRGSQCRRCRAINHLTIDLLDDIALLRGEPAGVFCFNFFPQWSSVLVPPVTRWPGGSAEVAPGVEYRFGSSLKSFPKLRRIAENVSEDPFPYFTPNCFTFAYLPTTRWNFMADISSQPSSFAASPSAG